MDNATTPPVYITAPQILKRYGISEMTLHRWQKNERLGFPKPMIVNRRKFFRADEIVQWERQKAAAA